MLPDYSRTKSESLAQINTAIAEINFFFQRIVFFINTTVAFQFQSHNQLKQYLQLFMLQSVKRRKGFKYDSMGCYSCAFGSYFRVRSLYKKTIKPKSLKIKNQVFCSPVIQRQIQNVLLGGMETPGAIGAEVSGLKHQLLREDQGAKAWRGQAWGRVSPPNFAPSPEIFFDFLSPKKSSFGAFWVLFYAAKLNGNWLRPLIGEFW